MPADTPDIIVTFDLRTSEHSEQGRNTVVVGFYIRAYHAVTGVKIGEAQEVSAPRLRQPGELRAAAIEAIKKALPRFGESLTAYARRVEEQGFDAMITFDNTPEGLLTKTYSAVRAVCGSAHQDQQIRSKQGLRLSYTARCKLTGHGLAEALIAKIKQAGAKLTPAATTAVRQMVAIEF